MASVLGLEPRVSVVVPTFGRGGRLIRLLEPLLDDPATLEVVVVVDGSPDGSLEQLQFLAADEPRIRPVWRSNGGDMAARQTGLDHSRGEIVLFLDDDVIAAPGLVSGHGSAHVGRERVLVLGAMPTALPTHQGLGTATTRLYAAEYDGACKEYARSSEAVLQHLWAGNVSLRRVDALKVGLVDPGFTATYFADQHFGLRLRGAGFRGEFRPELRAEHQHMRSLSGFRRDARRQGAGLYMLHVHHPGDRAAPTPALLSAGAPVVARVLAGAAWGSPTAGRVLEVVALGACAAANRAGATELERRLLLLLRLFGQAAGAAAARPRQGGGSPLKDGVLAAWRRPLIQPRDALLVLPVVPARIQVLGGAARWAQPEDLEHGDRPYRGVRTVAVGARTVAVALRSGAPVLLVSGHDRAGQLRRAGYHSRSYHLSRLPSGTVLLRLLRTPQQPAPLSAAGVVRSFGRRLLHGSPVLTVASQEDPVPFAVRAAVGGSPEASLLVGTDPRRRAVWLVSGPDGAGAVVKLARGPDAMHRSEHEQSILTVLQQRQVEGVPRPLGTGRAGSAAWSYESAAPGTALADLPPGLASLDAVVGLARWTVHLAQATKGAADWYDREPDEVLPLRGCARELRHVLLDLRHIPAVLVHGDLATGTNVLIHGDRRTVIDWETARLCGLPLVDLLPALCLGLVRARGLKAPDVQAARILSLCRGEDPDSQLLHSLVRGYLDSLQIPLSSAGRLAMLAWGYQASMRAVHDELVLDASLTPVEWRSPAELISTAWGASPALGLGWPALTSSKSGA